MKLVLIFFALVWICNAQAQSPNPPPKPIPPTTFYAEGMMLKPGGNNYRRTWYDQNNFRIRNDLYDESGAIMLATTITLFEQGLEYTINATTQSCISTPMTTWNNYWSFMDNTNYYGSTKIGGSTCQLWGKSINPDPMAELSSCWVGNTPFLVGVFLYQGSTEFIGTAYIPNFKFSVDPSVFIPPQFCPNNNTTAATSSAHTSNDRIHGLNLNSLFPKH